MKTSSLKAKGRLFQQKIRDMYREISKSRGLVDEDIESIGMGQKGVDIIFSPRAKEIFNHNIECKKHRKVSIVNLFEKHFEKYKNTSALKLLFHENDRSDPLVTMQAKDIILLFNKILELEDKLKPGNPIV